MERPGCSALSQMPKTALKLLALLSKHGLDAASPVLRQPANHLSAKLSAAAMLRETRCSSEVARVAAGFWLSCSLVRKLQRPRICRVCAGRRPLSASQLIDRLGAFSVAPTEGLGQRGSGYQATCSPFCFLSCSAFVVETPQSWRRTRVRTACGVRRRTATARLANNSASAGVRPRKERSRGSLPYLPGGRCELDARRMLSRVGSDERVPFAWCEPPHHMAASGRLFSRS